MTWLSFLLVFLASNAAYAQTGATEMERFRQALASKVDRSHCESHRRFRETTETGMTHPADVPILIPHPTKMGESSKDEPTQASMVCQLIDKPRTGAQRFGLPMACATRGFFLSVICDWPL